VRETEAAASRRDEEPHSGWYRRRGGARFSPDDQRDEGHWRAVQTVLAHYLAPRHAATELHRSTWRGAQILKISLPRWPTRFEGAVAPPVVPTPRPSRIPQPLPCASEAGGRPHEGSPLLVILELTRDRPGKVIGLDSSTCFPCWTAARMPPNGETLGAALLVRGRQGVTPTRAGMLRLGLRAATLPRCGRTSAPLERAVQGLDDVVAQEIAEHRICSIRAGQGRTFSAETFPGTRFRARSLPAAPQHAAINGNALQ
jgi:hypothetical protein